ncbi:hypothetical protein [Cellulomonas sp.]|uniref:hypothetical protein n=1 Tax=Cellulomonas sp. TaxID=40001 RepID=UPI003BAA76D9
MAPDAHASGQEASKVPKGLSEFFARVLGQLLLSSWLASAALVVTSAYLFALRVTLEDPTTCPSPCDWPQAAVAAGQRLSHVTVGGAVVILAVIVITTVLTQAFAFEAIRFLEGYWAANRALAPAAALGVWWHRRRRASLLTRLAEVRKAMRDGAFLAIRNRNSELVATGHPPLLTPDQLEVLLAGLEGRQATAHLTASDFEAALAFDWESLGDPQLRLAEAVLDNRLGSYPVSGWVMPTKLGNILRRHEQQLDADDIERYVQDCFDELPPSLQAAHDEERSRLDLYSTLVFLVPLVGVVAIPVLWGYGSYLIVIETITVLIALLAYRATIASAHAYGSVLLSIRATLQRPAQKDPAGAGDGTHQVAKPGAGA